MRHSLVHIPLPDCPLRVLHTCSDVMRHCSCSLPVARRIVHTKGLVERQCSLLIHPSCSTDVVAKSWLKEKL